VNKGDVKVWDTMGSSDESDWQRVFDVDHQFVGDCVIENGLIRLWIDEGAQYGLKFYYWNGSTWVHEGSVVADQRTPSAAVDYPYLESLQSISIEQVTVRVKLSESSLSSNYLEMDITISRGSYAAKCVMVSKDTSDYFIEYHVMTSARFRATNDAVRDDNVTSNNSDNTLVDNWAIALNPTEPVLHLVSGNVKPNSNIYLVHLHHPRIVWNDFLASDMRTGFLNIGIIPFSQVAYLFKEAESATIESGGSIDTSQTDDSGDSVLLDAQYDCVYYAFTAGTDLPLGRYLVFVRAKDTNQVSNDLKFWFKNVTDDRWVSQENAAVFKTLTASFAYYSVIIDLTDDDNGDTIYLKVEKNTSNANNIYADYFLIVPIGNGESWPQDLAHNAMRSVSKQRKIDFR